MSVLVLDPGALACVQDLGRPGWGALGIAPSGAMDPWALRLGNALVGNDDGAAAIEFAMNGPTIAFEDDGVVALTGSPFEASFLRSVTGSAFERDVDAPEAPFAASFLVRAGETLRIGKTRTGARGYIAIRGGISVDERLGSRSTQVAAAIGGRVLGRGDALRIGEQRDAPMRRARVVPVHKEEQTIRVIEGPQPFPRDALEVFFSEAYVVSPRFDRTGIRLQGPQLGQGPTDIDPEGVVVGSIQVPPDGQPIILCNDRPATGGYAKVATIIGVDMELVAHARPGDRLRFVRTTPQDARDAWRAREAGSTSIIEDVT